MPPSPSTNTTLGWPPRAAAAAASSTASSSARPTNNPAARQRPSPEHLVHPQPDRIRRPIGLRPRPSQIHHLGPCGPPGLGGVSVPRLLGLRQQPPPAVLAGRPHPQRSPALAGGLKAYPHHI